MKQGLWTQSAVPLYPVGYRIQVGLRVFHYCHAITALFNKVGEGDGGMTREMIVPAAPGLAGDLSVNIGTAGGANSCSTVLAHEYAGGWLATFGVGVPAQTLLRIKDNDAAIVDAVRVYLQDPLIRNMPVTDTCDLYHNIYQNVSGRSTGLPHIGYQSTVCVPLIDVTSGWYFWGQTWGPCLGRSADVGIGINIGERQVYFDRDGSIGSVGDNNIVTDISQFAGFVLATTWDARAGVAAAIDSIFYMLMLAP